jgi:replicative DNA helicase
MNRAQEIQYQNECDVLGSMIVNEDMTLALYKHLSPSDFIFKKNRVIYNAMFNIQRRGKFNSKDLLSDKHIDRGKYILNLMDYCLMTNIGIKCNWLLEQSLQRIK